MNQNKNRILNQFLQSNSYQNHHYKHFINTSSNSQSYFNKNLLNTKSKKISPNLESLNENYSNFGDNQLKHSYYQIDYKNVYTINNHNHSEYITNNSSDNFQKIIMKRRDKIKYNVISSSDKEPIYYNKTEENLIKRVHSSNYKNKIEEDSNSKNGKNINNTSVKKHKIQSSTSQPILSKNNGKIGYIEKTYSNRKFLQKIYQNNSKKEINITNHSNSNIIQNKNEKKNKQMKNYKSCNNINNNIFNNNMNNYSNELFDINLIDKSNHKYHSITVRKKSKIDKEELRNDLKKNYNISNSNINDVEDKLQKNNFTIKAQNNNRNNNRIIIKKILNEENRYLKNYHNHSLFESINLKQFKQKDLSKNDKLNKNTNTILDSENVLKNKIYFSNKNINTKRIQINGNKTLKKIPIRIYKECDNKMGISLEKKYNEKKINNKNQFEDKVKIGNFGYDSDIFDKSRNKANSENLKNYQDIIGDNSKINYIYEGRKRKQKALAEINKDLNLVFESEKNNNNSNENIKKNLGNVLRRIIKKNQKNQKTNIVENNNSYKKQQPSIKMDYCRTEENRNENTEEKERKIQKSNSINVIDKKESIITRNNTMEICKVNDITFKGNSKENNTATNENNSSKITPNNNIIIIINNADKNKFKRVIKTPKPKSNINIKNIENNSSKKNKIKNNNKNNFNSDFSNNEFKNKNNNNNNENKNISISDNNNKTKEKINNNSIFKKEINKTLLNNINENKEEIKNNDKILENKINNQIKSNNKNINNINAINKNDENKIKENKQFNEIKNNKARLINENQEEKNDNTIKLLNINEKKSINDHKEILNEKEKIFTENKTEDLNNNINKKIDKNITKENDENENKELNKDENIKESIDKIDIQKNINPSIEKNNNNEINGNNEINLKINNNIDLNKINNIKDNININNNKCGSNIIEGKDKKEIISDSNSNLNPSETNIFINNESKNIPKEEIIKLESENIIEDSIPYDIDSNLDINNNNFLDKGNNNNIRNSDIKFLNNESDKVQLKMEAPFINRYNNFLIKKESDEQISKFLDISQEKKPDLNNNDYSIEEIQNIKPVIQHNIERKRPVFTLPPSKKRSVSQGRPFNLVQKYYDENFILEDDEEEAFKKYIKYNEDSRDSKDNSRNSLNSKNSLCNSNKKSFKKLDDIDNNDKRNSYINENINYEEEKIEGNINDENNVLNNNKKIEQNIFKKISEEFYDEIEPF